MFGHAPMRLHLVLAVAVSCACTPAAFAHHFRYTAYLTGTAESPANPSPATGHVVLTIDFDENVLEVDATFDELLGNVTQAHIHAPTAAVGSGVADAATMVPSFDAFPTGVTTGDYAQEFDLALASTYNPDFITTSGGTISTAYNALAAALNGGKAYFDIHTSAYPDGEIRGFLSYVLGDYSDNGIVDAADYITWRAALGTSGDGLKADSDFDNVIDDDDYIGWRQNFGNQGLSAPLSGSSMTGASIPEPSGFALFASALFAPLWRRRRYTAASAFARTSLFNF